MINILLKNTSNVITRDEWEDNRQNIMLVLWLNRRVSKITTPQFLVNNKKAGGSRKDDMIYNKLKNTEIQIYLHLNVHGISITL